MRRSIAIVVVVLTCLASTLPVAAGGWATVHLDPSPSAPTVDAPWTVGFMVMRHGVTPFNADPVHLDARHRETGESIAVNARQEGAVGHFVAEVTFPRAGDWKWSITPEPFAATSFETLTVLDAPGGLKVAGTEDDHTPFHPAHIFNGTCANLGPIAFSLTGVGTESPTNGMPIATSGPIGATSAVPVETSSTMLEASLAEITWGPRAITIHQSEQDIEAHIACGDIGSEMIGGNLVVRLRQLNDSGDVGAALLRPVDASRTMVTILMIRAAQLAPPFGSVTTVAIDIVPASGGWRFDPADIEVPAGSTVTWENHTGVAHTITGDDLAFSDSGPLDPTQSFIQTFSEPGVYHYRCGPHPSMTGTVTVH